MEVVGEQEVIVKLAGGTPGNVEETSEFGVTIPGTAFRYVRRD